ncbi:hypothetical protein M5K25_004095 [Dendrobium thyrsiflorum]|uniref:CCHC-type domain-containing protein n=1 Tax=Dendrobium thyrsiflorum TaxID=117978 RepID=A0ABD0VLN0_DENTH
MYEVKDGLQFGSFEVVDRRIMRVCEAGEKIRDWQWDLEVLGGVDSGEGFMAEGRLEFGRTLGLGQRSEETSYSVPSHVVDGVKTDIPFYQWSRLDQTNAQLNAKCLNCFYCALAYDDFVRVSTCITGKEIWDIQCSTYEGTSEVKLSKLNILMHDYELFSMKPYESILEMYTRFTQIVTSLHALGKELSNSDKVNKIVRCLPEKFDAKVVAICEIKNLNDYSIDNLIGSLIAHEQSLSQRLLDAGGTIVLKVEDLAGNNLVDGESKQIASLTSKFEKVLKHKHQHQHKRNKGKNGKDVKISSEVICFKCRKPGHMKNNCPNQKIPPAEEKDKNKPIIKISSDKRQKISWADLASESSDQELDNEV